VGTVSEGLKEFRFRFIEDHREYFGVRYLSRNSFASFSDLYKWQDRPISPRAVENKELTDSYFKSMTVTMEALEFIVN
jgi:hypothetical protein